MTQTQQILAHLRTGPITPIDALQLYGCFRLAARIGELREAGNKIVTRMRETHHGAHVAEYRLVR